MTYERVICVVKGDESDDQAIETAVRMSSGNNRNRVHFVHVILVDHRNPLDWVDQARYDAAEELLRSVERRAGIGDNTRGVILQARAIAPIVVREAIDFNADAIVAVAEIVETLYARQLDDDAAHLVAHAPCAVIIIRDPLHEYDPKLHRPGSGSEASVAPAR